MEFVFNNMKNNFGKTNNCTYIYTIQIRNHIQHTHSYTLVLNPNISKFPSEALSKI